MATRGASNTGTEGRCPVAFDHQSSQHAAHWPENFKQLRKEPGLAWTDAYDGFWIATHYRDIIEVAQHPASFTSNKEFNPDTGEVIGGISIPPRPTPRGIPDESDSPEWDKFRTFLNRRLAPKAVETRRPRTEQFAAALIDMVIEKGEFDLVDDFTSPLPAISVMDMFGFPLEDWREFADPLHKISYTPTTDPSYPEVAKGWDQVRVRVEEGVAKRRANPENAKDDMLSYLAFGEIDGKRLDRDTLWSMALNVIIGGVDTTTALTSNTLIYLNSHHEERKFLIENPDRLAIAREEFVRFYTPVHGLARNCARDTVVNGTEVKAGERVLLAYASGNRDEEIFDRGDEIQIDRFPNRHVAFGAGMHRCIGSFQARMMFESMIHQVFTRMPDYKIDESKAVRYDSIAVTNGWASAPATFTPGPKVGATIE